MSGNNTPQPHRYFAAVSCKNKATCAKSTGYKVCSITYAKVNRTVSIISFLYSFELLPLCFLFCAF